jgi:ABC-2 type transport system permease protein
MSATTIDLAPRREQLGSRVTLAHVLRSEWTKLWTLRSTRWSLLLAFISMAGLGPLIAAVSMARWNQMGFAERLTYDPIDRSIGGYHLAQLAIGVLGVMVITGEYSTGMIRSSLMSVPRRLPVLWGKILVFSAVSFVLMLIAALIGFYASQAIDTQHHVNVSLGAPHALRVVLGSVLYMTVTGVFCTALGAILRSTAGAISAYVGLLFVLPGVAAILPQSLSNSIHPYLPVYAGTALAQVVQDPLSFSPWGGFALYCGYTVALVAVAAVLLMRRDA